MAGRQLFAAISNIEPFPMVMNISTESDMARMDRMLIDRFGMRLVLPRYEELEDSNAAAMLTDEFHERWGRLADVFTLSEGDDSSSRTETIDRDVTVNTARDDENKVSAFNSPALLTESGRSNTGTDNTKDDSTKTIVATKININSKIWRLTRFNYNRIITTVLHDIGEHLTLSLYA